MTTSSRRSFLSWVDASQVKETLRGHSPVAHILQAHLVELIGPLRIRIF